MNLGSRDNVAGDLHPGNTEEAKRNVKANLTQEELVIVMENELDVAFYAMQNILLCLNNFSSSRQYCDCWPIEIAGDKMPSAV